MSAVAPMAHKPQPGTAVDVELSFIVCPVTCGCSSAPGSSRGLAVVCWPERKSNIDKKHTSGCQAFVKTSGPPAACDSLRDRKSTRLNSSHLGISYAVFCFKKKNKHNKHQRCTFDVIDAAQSVPPTHHY